MCKRLALRCAFYARSGLILTFHASAFSSFPDTSLFSEGSILFSFKIRHIPPDPSTLALPEPPSPLPDRLSPGGHIPTVEQGLLNLSEKNSLAPPSPSPSAMSSESKAEEYRRWDERGREWLYGYVWFEQKKDRGIARGYMQVSASAKMSMNGNRGPRAESVEIIGHPNSSTVPISLLRCAG